MADEEVIVRDAWLAGGNLNMLHLGGLSHFPTFRSIAFLLEEVFPLLAPAVLERIRLDVAGTVPDEPHVRRIVEIASRYPHVRFRGFIPNIRDAYAGVDVHLVAATEATGLRTRIIEAFALGVPVISTTIGARGIAGLRPGENIFIADQAPAYAELLSTLAVNGEALQRVSQQAKATYDSGYCRRHVAGRLGDLLNTYFGAGTPTQRGSFHEEVGQEC
jgi:glycosyltransferase involved in cell wall biosynthesis